MFQRTVPPSTPLAQNRPGFQHFSSLVPTRRAASGLDRESRDLEQRLGGERALSVVCHS